MKICYLTWGETPRSYGVFGSQVIAQLVETSKTMPESKFYLVSGIPIIHSGLIREKLRYKTETKKIEKKLENICFNRIPIFSTQNFVISSRNTFKLMHIFSNIILANYLSSIKPNIVHCRSYHSAWAALKAKKENKLEYKIIFDARGIYPEEVAFKKNFSPTSRDYLFLKNVEKILLENSDISISVSDTMLEAFKEFNYKRIEKIYLSAPVTSLKPKVKISNKYNNFQKVTYCYLGALTENTWHQLSELLRLYKFLRTLNWQSNLKIITTSNHLKIKQVFSEFLNEISVISIKTVKELKEHLGSVDIGLLQFRNNLTFAEKAVGHTILGTKTVEYLSAGLPIIVNKYCGGAATFIKRNKIGISYDPNTFKELSQKNISYFLNDGRHEDRARLAEKFFDYKSNAEKYKELYNCLK